MRLSGIGKAKRTFTLIFVMMTVMGTHAFAGWEPMRPLDATAPSCPVIDGEKHCFMPVLFSPIALRKDGQWNDAEIEDFKLSNLSAETRSQIERNYRDLFILHSLAVSSDNRFIVSVTFRYGTELQTNYIAGQFIIAASGQIYAKATSFAEASEDQFMRRVAAKESQQVFDTRANLWAIPAVRNDDLQRIKIVKEVLNEWLANVRQIPRLVASVSTTETR